MKAITYLGIAVVLVACFAVPPTVVAPAPTDTTATQKKKLNPLPVGGGGGSGGGTGGNSNYTFDFYQPSSPNALVNIGLVSHSRVGTPVADTPATAKALLQYWIYDANDILVAYVNDNVGGHHPNFFSSSTEANQRTPEMVTKINQLISEHVTNDYFPTYESKGNNHLTFFNKQLPLGNYTWVVHNKGNTKQRIFVGYANSETENVQVNEVVLADTTVTFNFTVALHPTNPAVPMKLNANNYDL